ncbi:MAG: cation transporter, partial [Oscillospiraceae bacterium]|nr:cation transporter [Oscillospiraceae bacterium]
MKTERKIFIAFILNLAFSIFELIGGLYTGSVAILSDAVHDAGDASSIGLSFFLEKKSKKEADKKYTYGYGRYSVLGGTITALILLIGSLLVIYNAVMRIIHPTQINYDGMIIFAVVGVCVNFCATLFTRGGHSLNQKAVNLHMLEDVLGWAVVLTGAIVMRFTDFSLLDPIMSIGVSIFILFHAAEHLREGFEIFLGKTPEGIDADEIKRSIEETDEVSEIRYLRILTTDGKSNHAAISIVARNNSDEFKERIRNIFRKNGIENITLEIITTSKLVVCTAPRRGYYRLNPYKGHRKFGTALQFQAAAHVRLSFL